MTSNEVTDLLAALRDGTFSLDAVAQRFRDRSWPRTKPPAARTYLELAARAQQDPDPYVPGSFDDVAAAYHRGDITDDQYDALAQAMAESKRDEDPGGSAGDGQAE